jgi:tryptophan synthase alpha chain|tara:strand:- start:831 stop:1652 length:822 start_codon:yes stop_codon:yes gene_type:complete
MEPTQRLVTSDIEKKFYELEHKGEGTLIGYLTLGDPDINSSIKLIEALCENVDILELGIPFSDPIADGPIIQAAIDRALNSGMNTEIAFDIVRDLRKKGIDTPFIFMTYYNILLQYGEDQFIKKCKEVGVQGILVSDLPINEAENVLHNCEIHGVDFIFLIAPTTTKERVNEILKKARGFIYLVSTLGTTGVRTQVYNTTIEKTNWALKYIKNLPLAVGFGISRREHVRAVINAGAKGVVVGSAFVDLIGKKGVNAESDLRKLSLDLKEGTKK